MLNGNKSSKKVSFILCLSFFLMLTGCSTTDTSNIESSTEESSTEESSTEATTSQSLLATNDLFTTRDLTQSIDYTDATYITLVSDEDISITEEGVYVISGTASNVTINVNVEDSEKVQIVLDDANITNNGEAAIYVENADKVFITTVNDSNITITGTFNDSDAAIYSKDDLTFNGTATLNISSSEKGINCKNDLKITGGTYVITSSSHGIDATDSILIDDGTITITTEKDGLHASNSEDDSSGYIYIGNGTITIQSNDDAIHANSFIQIDGGTFTIDGVEGIEATYVQINGGTLVVDASNNGFNAANQSSAYDVTIEFTGGTTTINVDTEDGDAIDSNGNLIITGGTIYVYADSTFKYDEECTFTGGTVFVNGTQVTTITE